MFNDISLKNLLVLIVLAMSSVALAACEEKSTSEKIEDAAEDISDGVDDAADNFRN